MFSGGFSSFYTGTNVNNNKIISRQEHLDSYVSHARLKQSTIKVFYDDTTYDTIFKTVSNNTLVLRVSFPAYDERGNAAHPPKFTLVGIEAKEHPWLEPNTYRVIGYDPIQSLTSWTNSGLKLGAAVDQVIGHFQKNPPIITRFKDKKLEKMNPSLIHTSISTTGAVVHDVQDWELKAAMDKYEFPPVPSNFPEFDNLSKFEMESLLQDPNKLTTFLLQHNNYVQYMQSIKNSLLESNYKTASQNLDHTQRYSTLHQEVKTLQTCLADKVEKLNELHEETLLLASKGGERDDGVKNDILADLKKSCHATCEESNALLDKFTSGKVDTQEFMTNYFEMRMLYHVRMAKMERLRNS
jgi:hypothetical protein